MFALAGLVGVVAGGVVASCAVTDTDYCMVSAQCPMVQTDMGMVQLTCHSTRHVCVGKGDPDSCSNDSQCDFKTPHCDSGTCKPCTVGDNSDKSCAQRADGRRLCVNASDGSGTMCVACQKSTDCPKESPICDNQACRPCSAHQDCEGQLLCDNGQPCTDSLVCIQAGDFPTDELAGRCAQNGMGASTGRVIYVNSAVPDPDGKTNVGTELATAVNGLHRAMDLAHDQSRRYIRLIGMLTDAPGIESSYVIKDSAVSFIGAPVKSSANPTTIASVQGRNTLFQATGGSLSFDQVNFIQLNANQNTVTCAGTQPTIPTFIVRRSVFSGGTDQNTMMTYVPALSITNCNTLLDGNIIGLSSSADLGNAKAKVNGTAISLTDNTTVSSFTVVIQNNLIVGNAGNALDMSGIGRANGKFIFRFNTIVGNGRGQLSSLPAIGCPGSASSLEFSSSIVVGNAMTTAGGSQFLNGSYCNLRDVVVGTTEKGTNLGSIIAKDPDLGTNFRLRSNAQNIDCCIDKITPPTGTPTPTPMALPKTDVDGISRPQGISWDIGASEYKP